MNQRHRPNLIDDVTKQSGKLAKIQQKAVKLQEINHFLTNELMPDSDQYCRVANLRQGILVIEVSSGVWSTRLTQLRSHFIDQLRRTLLPSLISIEIKVNPSLFVQAPEPKANSRKISAQTAEHLSALAQHSPPELAKKLERLAKLARR